MSAKPPVSVFPMASVCGLVAWVIFVHLLSEEELLVILVLPIVWSLPVWTIVFFAGLTLRDTIRQRGIFGINFFKRIACPVCSTRLRRGITIPDWKEVYYGGWTCYECGIELNQFGHPWKEQNTVAKWAVLRAAEDTNERKRRRRHQEERIRDVKDQMQRGEIS
jgi:hypothetical protein